MSGKLKVYGINTFLTGRQNRTIAAVTSQKEFAKLINTSLAYVREYGCETGNEEEIKLAFSDIGTVFIECQECKNWHKWVARREEAKGGVWSKPKAKFKVGQVVCVIGVDPQAYAKLISWDAEDENWNTNEGYFDEREIRPLTRRERGGV